MKPLPNLFGFIAVISAGAVAAFAGLLYFIRLPPPSAPHVASLSKSPFIRLSRIDRSHPDRFAEDADLLDPVPLFSPTPHNASELELPAELRREPGSHFASFPARYCYTENSFDLKFPHSETSPLNPAEALEVGKTSNVLSEFGQRDSPIRPLRDRLALIEVVKAQTGAIVYSQSIVGPEPNGFPAGDWRPVEAIATFDLTGLVGTPALTTGASSASEEADTFFLQFLAKRFHLGGHLAPGVYIIRMGP